MIPPSVHVALAGCHGYRSLSPQVQRNCCLTLCNFSIPEELEFQYSRVNQLLLKILEPARQDESIQRIAVHLCNALVCQVDNQHKEAVGKMGFVKVPGTSEWSEHGSGSGQRGWETFRLEVS